MELPIQEKTLVEDVTQNCTLWANARNNESYFPLVDVGPASPQVSRGRLALLAARPQTASLVRAFVMLQHHPAKHEILITAAAGNYCSQSR